jgi:hypothetical protein
MSNSYELRFLVQGCASQRSPVEGRGSKEKVVRRLTPQQSGHIVETERAQRIPSVPTALRLNRRVVSQESDLPSKLIELWERQSIDPVCCD